MNPKLYFVTGNPHKVAYSRETFKHFNIDIEQIKVDLIEPREEEPELIAVEKAIQAMKIVNKPLIVEDSGIFIKSLNGFPKTFVHFAESTIGVEGIIKLMAGVEDRSVSFKQCLAYFSPEMEVPKLFSFEDTGFTLATDIYKGPDAIATGAFDLIICPPNSDRPLCTYDSEWRINREKIACKDTLHYLQLSKFLTSTV